MLTSTFHGDFDGGSGSSEDMSQFQVNSHSLSITSSATCATWDGPSADVKQYLQGNKIVVRGVVLKNNGWTVECVRGGYTLSCVVFVGMYHEVIKFSALLELYFLATCCCDTQITAKANSGVNSGQCSMAAAYEMHVTLAASTGVSPFNRAL